MDFEMLIFDSSCTKTIHSVVHDPTFNFLARFDWAFRFYQPMLSKLWDRLFQSDFEGNEKEVFRAHYSEIRRLVTKDRLLEFAVEDGWEPLCKFLGTEAPTMPFPKSNATDDFVEGAVKRNRAKLGDLSRRVGTTIISIGAVGCGVAIAKGLHTVQVV